MLQNKNRLFLPAVILAIILSTPSSPANSLVAVSKSMPNQPRLSVTRKNYSVKVDYAVLPGSGTSISRLNAKLKRAALLQYRHAVREHLKDRVQAGEPKGEFTAKYKIESFTPKAASLSCKTLDYAPDAATSAVNIKTFNYSLHPLKEVEIQDIFLDGVDYQKVLKIISTGKLFALTADSDWSIAHANDEFKDYAIDKQGFVFFFKHDTPNEIIEVFVPIHQICHLMKPAMVQKLWSLKNLQESDEEISLAVKDLDRQLAILAIGNYTRMINANPADKQAFVERGKWYGKLGRSEIAKEDLLRGD